jgi:hypothetical protein
MAFYQNLFDEEFRGNWVLSDRQYVLTFTCPPNKNKSDWQLAWNVGPWDFSVVNTLTLNFAFDTDFKNYSALAINIAGVTPAATTAQEVVAILNANATFADMFFAELNPIPGSSPFPPAWTVLIRAKPNRVKRNVRLWISNDGAETKMRFNKKAGVSELPTYFDRHTIENRFNWPDSVGMLIHLDETDPTIDQPIIEDAGFVPADMQEDWELLKGRASGLFTFQKLTIDGSDRITEIIEYPAGAKEGDFARKIAYVYTGANTNPSEITEIPYVLQTADLITP